MVSERIIVCTCVCAAVGIGSGNSLKQPGFLIVLVIDGKRVGFIAQAILRVTIYSVISVIAVEIANVGFPAPELV
jgi:hypothetical protein